MRWPLVSLSATTGWVSARSVPSGLVDDTSPPLATGPRKNSENPPLGQEGSDAIAPKGRQEPPPDRGDEARMIASRMRFPLRGSSIDSRSAALPARLRRRPVPALRSRRRKRVKGEARPSGQVDAYPECAGRRVRHLWRHGDVPERHRRGSRSSASPAHGSHVPPSLPLRSPSDMDELGLPPSRR